jgi:hypothetical protein
VAARDRVLVEDGAVAFGVAAGVLNGGHNHGDRIIHRGVCLTPVLDRGTTYLVIDRGTDETVGVLNADAIASARALVSAVDVFADELEDDR